MKKLKTYEECSARIEEIISLLQSNSVSLSESIKLYSEASELLNRCHELLENAKLELSVVLQDT